MKWFQQEALFKEIKEHFRRYGGSLEYGDHSNNHYFDWLLKEILEKHLGKQLEKHLGKQ